MTDNSQTLQAQVLEAYGTRQPLSIVGSGSKAFYGLPVNTDNTIDTLSHQGICSYEPNELVLTARAGTPMSIIEATLAENEQMLSCEAPHYGPKASFGGMIAAGISGPRRPWGGSISDLILGCKMINGEGEILQFGGQVMKNVAGYDVSRLMAGSMGCLGVILEASIKVVPKPKAERSFRFKVEQKNTPEFVNKLAKLAYPVSGSCHDNTHLIIRFSAGINEIAQFKESLQKDFSFLEYEEESTKNYWSDLKEQNLKFFNTEGNLWRFSMSADASLDIDGEVLMEWNGAQRWLKTELGSNEVFEAAAKANASATLFKARASENLDHVFQPLPKPLMQWHRHMKKAFDPAGIFNPGKMYKGL